MKNDKPRDEIDCLLDWADGRDDRPAVIAFTAGPARQIAYRIEGLRYEIGWLRRVIESAHNK